MKHTALLLMALVTCTLAHAISLADLPVRDPFILTDSASGYYYLYLSSSVQRDGHTVGGVAVYRSRDLSDWQGPLQVLTLPDSNWAAGVVWAPEVHYYRGQYYLFATINSDIEWKQRKPNWLPYVMRGTQIFHSTSPEGPFLPFGTLPHTPMDKMCLDGTLWVEQGVPYMVYCHEWVQCVDGEMHLQRLSADLSHPEGNPTRLFCASAAPWSTGRTLGNDAQTRFYVTDGCFIYRTRSGRLLMLWSSFKNGDYAIGIAESTTGRITGPWTHQPQPLFERDGGHGMLFRTFDGRLMLALHQPNSPTGAERARLFEIADLGHTLVVKP